MVTDAAQSVDAVAVKPDAAVTDAYIDPNGPKHLLIYVTPHGQLHDSWRPNVSGETIVNFAGTLGPLQPYMANTLMFEFAPIAPLPKNDPAVATEHTFEGLVLLTAQAPPSWKGTVASASSLDELVARHMGGKALRVGVFGSGPGPCWVNEGAVVQPVPLQPNVTLAYASAFGTTAPPPFDVSPSTNDALIEKQFGLVAKAFVTGGEFPVAVLGATDPPPELVGPGGYHQLAHDAHDKRDQWVKATTWYTTKLVAFLQSLDDKTRKETVVFWISDQYRPWHHTLSDQTAGDGVPVVIIADRAGPLKTGRFVHPRGYTHGDLLLSVGSLFGVRALSPGAVTKGVVTELFSAKAGN